MWLMSNADVAQSSRDCERECRLGTGATSAPISERAIDFDLPNHGIAINRVELFDNYRGGRFEPAMRRCPHSGALGRVDHLELGTLRPSGAFFASTEDAIESGGPSPRVVTLGDEYNPLAACYGVSDGNDCPPPAAHPGRWWLDHIQPVATLELAGSPPSLPLSCGRAGGYGDTVLAGLLLSETLLLLGHVFLGGAHHTFHLVDTTGKGLFESDGASCERVPFSELSGNIAFCEIGGFVGRGVQRVFDRIGEGVLPEFVEVIFELFNRLEIHYNFEQKLHLHVDLNTGKH